MEVDKKTGLGVQQIMEQDSGWGLPELTDRELACWILPELDYEAQLIAITDLLARSEETEKNNGANRATGPGSSRRPFERINTSWTSGSIHCTPRPTRTWPTVWQPLEC